MTKKYDNFIVELRELCLKHEVELFVDCSGGYINIYDIKDSEFDEDSFVDMTDDPSAKAQ